MTGGVALRAGIVLLVGWVAAFGAAAAFGMPGRDVMVLTAVAGGGAVGAAAVTAVALARVGGRRLGTHVLAVGLGATASTAVGVSAAAKVMFLSAHDLKVLTVVLLLSAAVATASSVVVGARFRAGVDSLARQAEDIAHGRPVVADGRAIAGAELRRLRAVLRQAGVDLAESVERQRRLERSRRELVAWVSHDLRSPIGAIRAMAEALEDGVVDSDADAADYHRAIRRETEYLSSLVDDLFELARIEAGAVPASDVPFVPLQELLAEIVESAQRRAIAREVEVVGDLEAAGPELVVAADLRRALDNLVDNAIRHTGTRGVVTVRAATRGDVVAVVVSDECGGIPADDIGRVFEVAFRGDAARGRDTGRAGLGLAIAKGLVEARDGDISVRNAAQGCEFTVALPVIV